MPDVHVAEDVCVGVVQERMMREVLEALAYSSSSGWQDEACQALEEWWIDGALFRPRER
jgi:hypothetical protein